MIIAQYSLLIFYLINISEKHPFALQISNKKIMDPEERLAEEWPWLVGIMAVVILMLLIISCYFCWKSKECAGEQHFIDPTKPISRSSTFYNCPIHGPVNMGYEYSGIPSNYTLNLPTSPTSTMSSTIISNTPMLSNATPHGSRRQSRGYVPVRTGSQRGSVSTDKSSLYYDIA